MNRISRNLSLVYKAERLIARRRFAVVQGQTVMMAISAIVGLIGLVLTNVAFFFVLEARMSPAAAAGILAAVNLGLAIVLATMASRLSAEREIAPAVEVRDMALAELEAEIDEATQEVRHLVDSVKNVRRDPLGSVSTLLVPVITAALKK